MYSGIISRQVAGLFRAGLSGSNPPLSLEQCHRLLSLSSSIAMADKQMRLYDFKQVKEGLVDNKILLIDVRNPYERRDPGRIPGSVNVPFVELKDAFSEATTDEEFEAKYDFKRPKKDFEKDVVLYCLKGGRSKACIVTLKELGYDNFAVYEGSFDDWSKNLGRVIKGSGYPLIEFEELKEGLLNESLTVIDVRKLKERQEPGFIPGTKHVELSDIWRAFSLSDAKFEAEFGFPRPNASSPKRLVLHCMAGKRATDAADKLSLLGLTPTVYKGSFKDWVKNKGPVEKLEKTNGA